MTKRAPEALTTFKELLGNMQRGVRQMGFLVRKPIELEIHLAYDDEADVWYVAESDIPGLRLEAENPQALIERLSACASEMIHLNEAEINAKFSRRKTSEKRMVSLRPVFDSPLILANA